MFGVIFRWGLICTSTPPMKKVAGAEGSNGRYEMLLPRAGLDEPVDPTDRGRVLPHPDRSRRRRQLERRVLLPVLIRILGAPAKAVGFIVNPWLTNDNSKFTFIL